MKIKLLDWSGNLYEVEIPDDAEFIEGEIVSGDQIITYPVHFDTGKGTRMMNFYDGSFRINREDFYKLDDMRDPYDIFEI
jgi:hypothetical protein